MNEKITKLLGSSAEFLRAIHTARMVAGTDASVLVLGERGAGKELLAREIHASSRRREKPFLVVNCAGITEQQLDAELSGCAAAKMDSTGATIVAEGGTLFLDEVGELSEEAQAAPFSGVAGYGTPRLPQCPDCCVVQCRSPDAG